MINKDRLPDLYFFNYSSLKHFGSSGWYEHQKHAEVATVEAITVANAATAIITLLFNFFISNSSP